MKDKDRQLEEKERQLGIVNEQLKVSEQVIAQCERQVAELKQQLSQRVQQNTKEVTSFKLRWREGKRAPCVMNRWCDAVVNGNVVYVKKENTVNIYSYDVTSDNWSQLPDCVNEYCSITVINGCLTTIGGGSYPYYSNELFSLMFTGTSADSGTKWTQQFPPMPTERKLTTSLCNGTTLIVAGGEGEGARALSTVEVLNTGTYQWSTAADLPQPTRYASATVCGDQLFMLGGSGEYLYVKSAYTCSISALLRSCEPGSLEASLKRISLKRSKTGVTVWRQLADLPVIRSTCESFHGRLLAIGGVMNPGYLSSAVYMFNLTTNSWEIISHMPTGRCNCFTAILPDNQLMVLGGVTDDDDAGDGSLTDMLEFAIVCDK